MPAFRKLSYADWDAVLRVNLDSVFNVTRPFIDGMLDRGWGRIVNFSSINGSKGQFGQTNYSAAKAGMHGFTKAFAQEVARKGVTVNTVSPGYLDTKMVTSMSEEVVKQVVAGIPVGRLGRPEEIAALVAGMIVQVIGSGGVLSAQEQASLERVSPLFELAARRVPVPAMPSAASDTSAPAINTSSKTSSLKPKAPQKKTVSKTPAAPRTGQTRRGKGK
ncbi:SDR family NAD(P)-dependent oxidoreductase [Aliiglaciecola aliphaticivorans]